jgi:hypothetical protein
VGPVSAGRPLCSYSTGALSDDHAQTQSGGLMSQPQSYLGVMVSSTFIDRTQLGVRGGILPSASFSRVFAHRGALDWIGN